MNETKNSDAVTALYVNGVLAVVNVTERFDQVAWSETACGDWHAADTARHLVAVVDWYDEWLDRAISGDSSIPFEEDEFESRNRVGIERYSDLDGPAAVTKFKTRAGEYLARVGSEWNRPFGYPGGIITAGLHCGIAATEWHLHAWDLSTVRGPTHEPSHANELMVAAANAIAAGKGGFQGRLIRKAAPMASKRQPWKRLLSESGRNTTG